MRNKKNKHTVLWIIWILLFTWGRLASATTVSVDLIDGHGTSEHQLATLRSLVIAAVTEHPDADYVSLNGELSISATINRLENQYILIMGKSGAGTTAISEQLKIQSFDEIDVAVKRLVAAVIENKGVEDTAARDLVVTKEQQGTERVKALKGFHFDLGVGVPLTNALQSYRAMYALGLGYRFDIQPFLLELRADFLVGYNEVSMNTTSLTLGGNYVWYDQRRYALFSGIEVGFGHAADNFFSDKSGFAIAANTGVILLRHATVNLDLKLRMMMIADKFNGFIPLTTSFLVGITF